MKEAWIPMWKTVRQKSAETVAKVLFTVASVGLAAGCGNIEIKSPIVFKSPTSTPAPTPTPEIKLIPTPVPTPTHEPTPTKIPTPTPTRIPTATPRPTETPIPPPTPTKTPEPSPTPKPTPKPTPTPVPPKTELKPGQELNWVQPIENRSREPKSRSIYLDFQGGNKGNLKIEIRVPLDSEKTIEEGSTFILPANAKLLARITAIVPPGASSTCFEDIFYNLQTREPGWEGARIERVRLAQDICTAETLHSSIVSSNLDKTRVISYVDIFNSSDVNQKTGFRIENCNFGTAEREIWIGTQRIFPDQPRTIPANKGVEYIVYSTRTDDKAPTDPKCDVKIDRVLEK